MNIQKHSSFIKICSAYFLAVAVLATQYYYYDQKVAEAQSMATLIGGTTEGISDICCNGVILTFDSIDPSNMYILDGDALWDPIQTNSYDNHNEFTEGYYTMGKLKTGICLDITAECESGDIMPVIWPIGTGAATAGF